MLHSCLGDRTLAPSERELRHSGGSGGSIGGFRQLVIPSAVKGFMISLRSRDFSETLATGFIVTKPGF
ncbi:MULTISPECIES: hypothetical protein [unclassified Microcoleus]|uniref:hypothetical protein n=1 Tax=unclassified Microcoleus TaxID=2642155 RepID=UPI002FCFCA25